MNGGSQTTLGMDVEVERELKESTGSEFVSFRVHRFKRVHRVHK